MCYQIFRLVFYTIAFNLYLLILNLLLLLHKNIILSYLLIFNFINTYVVTTSHCVYNIFSRFIYQARHLEIEIGRETIVSVNKQNEVLSIYTKRLNDFSNYCNRFCEDIG